jgi:dTDP-4-amino-4,6-dideoxygalactose transaminase
VIVDIDESIAMDPAAAEMAIGPRTRAILAVHMWGTLCDMDRLGEIAARAGVHLLEDACQCVGGSFGGRKAGAIGDVGTFSFNYFKNITCGEGGAVVTNDPKVAERIRCMVDCCGYFWSGRKEDFQPFASQSSRASEFEGAMLNVQLDRIDGLIERLQAIRRHLLERIGDAVPRLAPSNCPGEDCGTGVLFQFERPEAAARFTENAGGVVLAKTGRHTYTEWDPILNRKGAHHPAMDPFRMPANAECRMDYSRDMCARSLDILSRTVRLPLNPHMDDEAVDALAEKIRAATA